MRFPLRPMAAACLFSGLLGACPWLHASDAPQVKTSPRKVRQDGGAAASVDPMDRLRERLAAKLGANAVLDGNPNVLQVSIRPSAGQSAGPTARMAYDGGASAGQGGGGSRGKAATRSRSSPIPESPERARAPLRTSLAPV